MSKSVFPFYRLGWLGPGLLTIFKAWCQPRTRLKDSHDSRNECQDGIELRKCGVDQGVGLYIVSL